MKHKLDREQVFFLCAFVMYELTLVTKRYITNAHKDKTCSQSRLRFLYFTVATNLESETG